MGLGGDKAKTKKCALLPAIFLISFLFSGCATVFFSLFYGVDYDYYYDKYRNIITKHFDLTIEFGGSSPFPPAYARNEGVRCKPSIIIRVPDDKFVKNVVINSVIINTGENEYTMAGREITYVLSHYDRHIYDGYGKGLPLRGDDLDDIRRTGHIDCSALVDYVSDIPDDENYSFNVHRVRIDFREVSLFFARHKKIRIRYDFSVELTTGETITVNKEIIARRKVRYYPKYQGFLPTV